MTSGIRRRLAVLVAATVGIGGARRRSPSAAPIVFSTTPIAGWSTNGIVRTVLIVGDTVYAGGDFTQVHGPGGAPTVARARLAAWDVHTGALRTGFSADANGRVESLASDGTKLFVGGDFTTIKGASKSRLAALDLTTGNVISGVDRRTRRRTSTRCACRAARLYVGGAFGTLGGATRSRIGAVSTANGAVDPTFNPNANDAVHGIVTSPDGTTVYVGGDFTTRSAGSRRGYLAAVSTRRPVDSCAAHVPVPDRRRLGPTGWTASTSRPPATASSVRSPASRTASTSWSTTTGQMQWYYQVDGDTQAVRYYNGNVYFGFHEGALGDHTVRLLAADAATGQLEQLVPTADRQLLRRLGHRRVRGRARRSAASS